MIRSNVGNQVANGVQVLSVGGFTGGNYVSQKKKQKLADASSALNNMTQDEVRQVGQMRADEMREQLRKHNNKTDGFSHLSDSEQQAYGDKKAEDLRKYISGDEEEETGSKEENTSVDELVSNIKSTNSPQSEELGKKIIGDIEYSQRWVGRNIKTGGFAGYLKEDKGEEK